MIIKNVQACFDWDHGGDCFDTRSVIYKLHQEIIEYLKYTKTRRKMSIDTQ